jgi:hypothetical protein
VPNTPVGAIETTRFSVLGRQRDHLVQPRHADVAADDPQQGGRESRPQGEGVQ